MNEFAQAMVDELRTSCRILLEHTIRRGNDRRPSKLPPGPIGQLMESGHHFLVLAKPMMSALHTGQRQGRGLIDTPTPKRAHAPREPWKYVISKGRCIPRSWQTYDLSQEFDPRATAWWLSVLKRWLSDWSARKSPLEQQLQETRQLRAGSSRYAQADLAHLDGLLERMLHLEDSMLRLTRDLQSQFAVVASSRPPDPCPPGPAWSHFRRLASLQSNPDPGLSSLLSALGTLGDSSLPLGYLYQRWCGFQLVQALKSSGWAPLEDPSLKLLVGGHLALRKGETQISLLVEARFTQLDPTFGLQARTFESTPDYVLLHTSSPRPTAFVLDPTLHTGADERRRKGKYLQDIHFTKPQGRFGQMSLHGPQCSWAAAPLTDGVCRIEDPTSGGRRGTVPMNPLDFKQAPLMAWVAEFEGQLIP